MTGRARCAATYIGYCKVEAIGDAVRWKLDRCTRKTRPRIGTAGRLARVTRTSGRHGSAYGFVGNAPKVGVLADADFSYDERGLLCLASGAETIPSGETRYTTKLSKWTLLPAMPGAWTQAVMCKIRARPLQMSCVPNDTLVVLAAGGQHRREASQPFACHLEQNQCRIRCGRRPAPPAGEHE